MPATDLVSMSAQELDRLTVIERVLENRLSQVKGAKQLGVTPRQVRRLIGRYREDGAAGLVSKKRGMRGNRAYPDGLKNAVIALARQRYYDFGPTLITEKLAEQHDIQLACETVRRWLREAGIWKDRRQRRKRVHKPRYRRESLAEMIELGQLDKILSWQEERTVSHSLTVQYDRVVYLLEPTGIANDLQRKKVRVYDYPDGRIAIKHEGTDLPYSVFDKVRQVKQADIVSNKRLGAVLLEVKEQQRNKSIERSKSAPQRRGQKRICKEKHREFNPAANTR